MNSQSLKILMLGDSRSFHLERLVKELKSLGHEVCLASLEDGEMEHVQLKRKGKLKLLHYTLAASQIDKLAEQIQPDIIYAHFATGYGHLVSVMKNSKKLPVMLNLWGSDVLIVPHKSPLHMIKAVKALKTADYLIADSRYLMDAAMKLFAFENCEVIAWGIKANELDKEKRDHKRSIPLRIIVPRMHEAVYENDFIVDALAELVHQKKIQLSFPSFGSLVDEFRSKLGSLLDNGIYLYEKLERDQFLEFFAAHDIYLSNSSSDSSPVSLIEAQALGLIPVVRDIPGVQEWIDEQSGFLYETGNSEQLKDIILKLISTDDNFYLMRSRNLERVKKSGLFESNVARQVEIMHRLIAGRKSHA